MRFVQALRRVLRARLANRESLSVISFEELFPKFAEAHLTIECPGHGAAGVRLNELLYIGYLANRKPAAQIFEFGTGFGRTTLNMALNVQRGGHVYSLDLPPGKVLEPDLYIPAQEYEIQNISKGILLRKHQGRLPFTLFSGESTEFDFSRWFGKMDLVFVDGGHSTKVIERDTANALRMVKPEGGIILWHDYLWRSCPEVVRFLNVFSQKHSIRRIKGTKTVLYSSD